MLERLTSIKESAAQRWQSIDRGHKMKAGFFLGVIGSSGLGLYLLGQSDLEPARGSTERLLNEPDPTAIPPIREVVNIYVVNPGDTLTTIAEACGTTVEQILATNDISDPNMIREGQLLNITCQTDAESKAMTETMSEPLTLEDVTMEVAPQGDSLSDALNGSEAEIDASLEGQARWDANRQLAEQLGGLAFLAWLIGQAPDENPDAILNWMSAENGDIYVRGMYDIYRSQTSQ